MEGKYYVEATVKTPEISIDTNEGVMVMKGRSLPEDSIEFYEPIMVYLEKATAVQNNFTLKFYLEYMNTSSSSILRTLLEFFTEKKSQGELDFKVEWYFEEDDYEMEEMGKHYEQTIDGLSMEFIEVDTLL